MNQDQDSSIFYIEDTLLLQFLIARYTEMLGTEEPILVPVWSGLGLVALYQNKELENAFKTLISSDSYTVEEVLTSSIDLFLAELNRLESADTTDYLGKPVEHRPLSPWTERKFLFWSWGEGRKMWRGKDFRFYPIWELVSWLGMTSDEYLKGFEERCRFSDDPVEVRLDHGLEVVKAALFRRGIGGTSFEQHMLKTPAPQIDKETEMKFMTVRCHGSSLEPDLVIRLIMKQLSETDEPDTTELSPVLIALTLAAGSHNKEFHDRLKEQVTSSSDNAEEILHMTKDLFVPVLGQTVDDQDVDQERRLPDEQSCRRVLCYALGEAKRILDEKDFEFLRVFEVLTRAGLLCYSFRLCQFESACATVQDDPEDFVQKSVEIIRVALGIPETKD